MSDPLTDAAAAAFLAGPDGIRDYYLERFLLRVEEDTRFVDLRFVSAHGHPPIDVRLAGVHAFDFQMIKEETAAYIVAFMKCAWGPDGVFLSLDPDDEWQPPSERDRQVFKAAHVSVTVGS